MAESKNTLAKGMFVREHTYKNGTTIYNVAINVVDFCTFAKEHMNKDTNGNLWVNLKFIPNPNVTENKLTHTPILDDFYTRDEEQAVEDLTDEIFDTARVSSAERKITEAPAKKAPAKRKTAKSKKATAQSDDLPF